MRVPRPFTDPANSLPAAAALSTAKDCTGDYQHTQHLIINKGMGGKLERRRQTAKSQSSGCRRPQDCRNSCSRENRRTTGSCGNLKFSFITGASPTVQENAPNVHLVLFGGEDRTAFDGITQGDAPPHVRGASSAQCEYRSISCNVYYNSIAIRYHRRRPNRERTAHMRPCRLAASDNARGTKIPRVP